MTNIKAAVLGGFVALLGVVAGEGLAHADCDYPHVADVDQVTWAQGGKIHTGSRYELEESPADSIPLVGYGPTDNASYIAAMTDVLEGAGRGYDCEVIQLQDGSFEAQCDEVASPVESAACSEWAHGFGVGEDDADGMYEACMVIALHTGAVK